MRVRIGLFGSLSVLQINAAFENMNEVEVNGSVN